ncbi:hypothetical protein [Staphylococcus epidermidis]|uniref:hypothetical protein n=1 Tax=Staphylococcus epidermidis TaxID=1282 RepID=UPI00026C10BD|nr:hypothetical protein [Staphylococcus epidermidis]EJD97398.1 hypothetical protein HMPREF9986_11387 [Staphylococcus epidermidis NIHLM040]MCG7826493.1 hypothetical protein [Staphylococcus epidermidis]MCO6335633.1 hypothetical protein [Staphylococcus epidermidis]MCO6351353.1 hypothetical protein [Staphylococcus epidermidis]
MKKFLKGFILFFLIVMLGFAGGLGYSHYKDSKANTDVSSKETQTSNKNTHEDTISQDEMQNQVDNQTNEVSNETSTKTLSEKAKRLREAFNVNDEEAQILADVNKDGTITMDEMTPTLDRFAKEGKFQPSAGGTTNEAHHPKYTAEDARNMSDDEFLDAYTEGMSDDEAATIHESAQESNEYMKFLRGQVEARAKGQGGNY